MTTAKQQLFMPSPAAQAVRPMGAHGLQRQCACGQHTIGGGQCDACSQTRQPLNRLDRNPVNSSNPIAAPSVVHEVLSSPGQPLDAASRAFFEPRFSHDFSGVRVHTSAKAAASARAVNALAYTVGPDVVFGEGQYAPDTSAGRRLLAHELTHTIQQGGKRGLMSSALEIGAANDVYEQEATRISEQVLAPQTHSNIAGYGEQVTSSSLRVGPRRIARQLESPESPAETPERAISEGPEATPTSVGPECSISRGRGQSLPLASSAFRGERGFAYIPADGHPGPGGLLVTGTSVSIRISARWEEQIPDPSQRPPDQRNRNPNQPQYYLTFNGWVDNCDSVSRSAGSPASSVTSGNLTIGTEHTVSFASLIPGRYGLNVNPSTASAEPNRVLTGTVEVT